MRALINSVTLYIFYITSVFAAVNADSTQPVKTVSYEHVLNWSFGLIIVLCLFFFCVWFMRKMGALPISPKQNIRVVAGLSLGMREKLIVVQVGEKQLILGVTPGKIDNLLVLEGNEQLFQNNSDNQGEGNFSRKFKQLMTGATNE